MKFVREKQRKSVKRRASILKNINKIDKPLARLIKDKLQISGMKQHITRDFTVIKKMVREHYELYMHKFDKILEKHKLP